jgi:FixJ family two-component response regulator
MPCSALPRTPLVSIVDDDPSVRRALERLVEAAGYAVETFASAEEFLGSTSLGPVECLILDVHLNGMNGLDLKELLVARGNTVPVIFITAHDDAPTRARVDQSGSAFLAKPFDRQALIGAIRGVLGTRDGKIAS